MVELQQKMAKSKNIIMDGRDIGTVVLIDSKYKFYLTASIKERASRRYNELKQDRNLEYSLSDIEEDIIKRDNIDSNRKTNPLKKAEDAILIDTTDKTLEDVVQIILSSIKGR